MKQFCQILLLALLFTLKANSQGENNNWYFGDRAGINFPSGPAALYDSQMTQLEGVASISDTDGNLLFYTNGVNIWNRQHQIMTNGSGLTGNDTTQQVIIVPYPSHPTQYFIFTTSIAFDPSIAISYSIVDMALGATGSNGLPLGDVLGGFKNVPIEIPGGANLTGTEAITSVLDNLNSSYWILIPHGRNLYAYKLTNTGLSATPVLSNLPLPTTDPFVGYGEIKVSPNLPSALDLPYSNLISFTRWGNNNTSQSVLIINSFNNTTGQLTNHYQAMTNSILPDGAYSAEFSSDGLLLYLSQRIGRIHVFDLFSGINDLPPTIPVQEIYNNALSQCFTLQRGINNEIYLSMNDNIFLSRIANSNSYSLANLIVEDILINAAEPRLRNCTYGLPQLVPIASNSVCIPDIVLNSLETYNNYTYNASQSITTLGNYATTLGQTIHFNAGQTIVLQPNTHLANGTNFLGIITPCSEPTTRINSINHPGRIVYIELNASTKTEDVKLYPNPVSNGTLYIDTTANTEKDIVIYDVLGKQVLQANTTDNAINVNNLKAGVYIIKITEDGKTATRKLVIK